MEASIRRTVPALGFNAQRREKLVCWSQRCSYDFQETERDEPICIHRAVWPVSDSAGGRCAENHEHTDRTCRRIGGGVTDLGMTWQWQPHNR